MLVWLSGRTSAPDVKPPPAVLLSVSGRDLPLPGSASVLKNSNPIVTQLDIFEPHQETERCRRGGLELRLRSLGVFNLGSCGVGAPDGGYAGKNTSTRGGTVFGANEAQVADDFVAAAMVHRMIDAVDHRHVGKIKRAHAL